MKLTEIMAPQPAAKPLRRPLSDQELSMIVSALSHYKVSDQELDVFDDLVYDLRNELDSRTPE